MTNLAVRRLSLRLPRPELASPAQWAIEDALRLAGRDCGARHVVIRRLSLGRLAWGAGAALRDLAGLVDTKLRALIDAALPAESTDAAQADAVYFSSPAAARAVLAAKLLRGETPQAWFWPRAVPDFEPQAPDALERQMLALWAAPEGRVHLAADMAALAAERSPAQVEAAIPPAVARRLTVLWPGRAAQANAAPVFLSVDAAPQRMAPGLAAIAFALPQASPVRDLVIALALIAAAPQLAEEPALAIALAARVVATPASERKAPVMPMARPLRLNADAGSTLRASPQPAMRFAPDARQPLRPATDSSEAARPFPPAAAPAQARQLWPDEARSAAAGLFLLVQPLRFLGFEAWLKRHPDETAGGYGATLLRDIARRLRVLEDDPLWTYLRQGDQEPFDTRPWRTALAGLLRRRCKLTLAAVVRRKGWLSGGRTSLDIRYPAQSADIRLRRMAFDIDPGRVAWLGLTLAYHYRDREAP